MQQRPIISIITINYNSTNHTIELLNSIKSIGFKGLEVIVIDNASYVNPEFDLKECYPKVVYVRSDINLGFAGGNNLGIKIAKGQYLFFLNNDTLLNQDTIPVLLEHALLHPEVGIFSPKIIFNSEKEIQYAGSKNINPYTGRGVRIGHREKDLSKYSVSYYTDLAHGAAMFVPVNAISDVGLMPEVYFLYYEELDWCEQFKRRGYKIMYVGTTYILHKESASVSQIEGLKNYYMHRNRILFMRRNFHGMKYLIGFIFYIFFSIPKNMITSLSSYQKLRFYIKALHWNFKYRSTGELYF